MSLQSLALWPDDWLHQKHCAFAARFDGSSSQLSKCLVFDNHRGLTSFSSAFGVLGSFGPSAGSLLLELFLQKLHLFFILSLSLSFSLFLFFSLRSSGIFFGIGLFFGSSAELVAPLFAGVTVPLSMSLSFLFLCPSEDVDQIQPPLFLLFIWLRIQPVQLWKSCTYLRQTYISVLQHFHEIHACLLRGFHILQRRLRTF